MQTLARYWFELVELPDARSMTTSADPLRILLVDDDEDDFVLTRSMLARSGVARGSSSTGSSATRRRCARSARPATTSTSSTTGWASAPAWTWSATRGTATLPAPVILLTGQDDYEVDLRGHRAGRDRLPREGHARRAQPRAHDPLRAAPPPGDCCELRRSEERYARRGARDQRRHLGLGPARRRACTSRARWKTLLGYDEFAVDRPEAWFELVHPDDVDRLRREIDAPPGRAQPALRERAPHPPRRRQLALGAHAAALATRDRRRHADPHHRLAVRRHRAAQRPAAADPRRAARPPHRAAEPGAVHGPPRAAASSAARARPGPPLRRAVRRRRPLQARQRQPQPRRRRPPAGRARPAASSRSCAPATRSRRLGGDEFTILLDEIELARRREVAGRVGEAIAVADRRRRARAVDHREHRHRPRRSAPRSTASELLRNADIAMYDAKAQGGGRVRTSSTPSMHHRVIEPAVARDAAAPGDRARRGCGRSSSRSSTSGPASCAASRRSRAGPRASASVSPAEFIPVAEEAGLIGPLGALMLRSACETLGRLAARAASSRPT